VVVLLAPHHSRESLTLDISKIIGHWKRADSEVELVGFGAALLHDIIEQFFVKEAVVSPG
jgi:hypothetical protein